VGKKLDIGLFNLLEAAKSTIFEKPIPESFLQNGLSEVDFSWAGRGEPGCVRSGRGGPVVDDANDLAGYLALSEIV